MTVSAERSMLSLTVSIVFKRIGEDKVLCLLVLQPLQSGDTARDPRPEPRAR